ncbi:iron-containing alcohol dehydrogenase [Burkholderia plantarii]|uniref:iron-containing alcohol dehydrogenase n=1 Tax=Burkholderia plantarii TaxID=41899 RepID=UPI0006D8C039|nr:iron-containing alcohol dehydrogenase [Burkholderia plantarii]ALK32754.1 iron-containing alcohol dehydrogenase [Burkholderia plantarii]GLZ22808.1 hypothetical protein Bpla01_63370 [Burkholderia plantarii]
MSASSPLVFPGAAALVPRLLGGVAARRVVVFRGPRSFELSNAAALLNLDALPCDRLDYLVDDDLPTLESITAAGAFVSASGTDAILAIGGGTVIDTTKGARHIAAHPGLGAADALRTRGAAARRPPVCLAVPTTAGTGSGYRRLAALPRSRRRPRTARPHPPTSHVIRPHARGTGTATAPFPPLRQCFKRVNNVRDF